MKLSHKLFYAIFPLIVRAIEVVAPVIGLAVGVLVALMLYVYDGAVWLGMRVMGLGRRLWERDIDGST